MKLYPCIHCGNMTRNPVECNLCVESVESVEDEEEEEEIEDEQVED